MRILISAGGTGGGVYPAFAVAEALSGPQGRGAELHFVGGIGAGGMEPALIARSGIPWRSVHSLHGGPVHGVSPLRMALSAARLAVGLVQALALCGRLRPGAALVTGGWASLPVALAAWVWRVPVFAFVPDIEPALTLRTVGRFARCVAATTDQTAAFFPPGRVVATGYPLRRAVLEATRDGGIAQFGLDPARRTLLITGGSSGARSLNQAVISILPELLADEGLQIIHISGTLDQAAVMAAREQLPEAARPRYHVYAYLHVEMGLALAAADLIVCRAGASTLAELPYFGLPAILVPYPHAWRYQKVNADFLVARGGAIRLEDERLGADLLPAVRRLLGDAQGLAAMVAGMRELACADGAQRVAQLLLGA